MDFMGRLLTKDWLRMGYKDDKGAQSYPKLLPVLATREEGKSHGWV